ncbi:MAG: lamin tail domain-containing protein [Chitinophagales bacterium]
MLKRLSIFRYCILLIAVFSCHLTFADACGELFISEYVEGSSNNKCIEIYNPTGSAVDLAAGSYSLLFYFNGSSSAGTTINLSGSVASGDVYVVCDDSSNPTLLAATDQESTSSFFSGDDAIELQKDGTVIDAIGQVGTDPGSQWGAGLVSTQDNTIRRKSTIQEGDTDSSDAFDPATEWDGFANDTFDGIGSHTTDCIVISCTISEISVENISECDDNGTNDDAGDDTFTFDVTVTFADAPSSGSLDLTGDATTSVDVAGLDSPTSHTFTGLSAGSDGGSIDVTASFSEIGACTASDNTQLAPKSCSSNPCGGLFFSEYIEGGGNSKCLEIYNPTEEDIDLAADGYAVQFYSNGSTNVGATINLEGTIISGGTHVLCDDGSITEIFNKADQISTVSFYNGDDAVVLVKESIRLDIIGKIGEDPGSEWNVGGVGTANESLRRKSSVLEGDKTAGDDFDPSLEWDSYPQDNSDNLGVHVSDCISCDIEVKIAGNPDFCAGESAMLDAGIYEPLANVYEWSNGEMTQMIDTDVPGLYTVTVTNDAGCQGTSEIKVNALASFQISADSESVTQTNATGLLVYQVEVCGGKLPYSLDLDTDGFATASVAASANAGCRTILVTFSQGTDWVLTITDSNDCGIIVIDSQDLATTDYGVLFIVPTEVVKESCPGYNDGALTIEIDGGNNSCGTYDISWTGPSLASAGTVDVATLPASVSLTDIPSGTYTVVVTDCDGQSVTTSIYVGRVAGRGRGRGAVNCATPAAAKSALDNAAINFVDLYPNPFSQTTQLQFGLSVQARVAIDVYTLDGRKAASVFNGMVEEGQNNTLTFDGSNLAAGVYVLQLTTDSGVMYHEKLYIAK